MTKRSNRTWPVPCFEVDVGRVGFIGDQSFDPQDESVTAHLARWNVQNVRTKERHVNVEIIDGLEREGIVVAIVGRSSTMQMSDPFRLAAIETEVTRE